MKDLQRLVNIVTSKKLAQLDVPGKSDNEKLNALYLMICEGSVNSHREASHQLFGKTERFAAYQQLSTGLKKQLIDMLLLMDVNQAVNENADRAYQEAWRLATIAMLLARKGFIGQSIEYVDRALRLSITFEYADIIVYLTKTYRKQAATFLGDEEKFSYYHELYLKYSKLLKLESIAAERYEQLMVMATKANATKEDIALLGEQLFNDSAHLLEECDYLSVHHYIRFIQFTYLLNKEAYTALIDVCDETLGFFKTKTIDIRTTQLGFMSGKLLACIQLGRFEEGIETLNEAHELIDDSSQSIYFKINELGLLLCLHTKHYQKAAELLNITLINAAIRQQACYYQKQWKIYQAYLLFLEANKQVVTIQQERFALPIKLNKFLKKFPVYDKNKRDSNIPILIIQSLLLITLKRYDEAQVAIAMLEQYTSRYLRQNENFRSNCFINMLVQLPQAGFHRAASLRYAEKYWKKLKTLPVELSNQAAETEIIPYEYLWEMVLANLDMKRIKLKKIRIPKTKAS